jgi:transcriptional regulator with PAS, ATPase and Fis domain
MRGAIVEDFTRANRYFWEKLGVNRYALAGILSILDAIQEAIIVADLNGWVHYVNPAFTHITDVNQEARVGRKIHEVSPGCPLAQVLETRMPVYGVKYKMSDSDTETVCNAAPIIINDEMLGAVVVFQDVTDVISLGRKLNQSKRTIKLLNSKLSKVALAKYDFDDLIGDSPLFTHTVNKAKRVSQTDSTVLIIGETGTGKELFAHAIHNSSSRAKKPFIKINCASIPDNLLESEFFGFEKGSFTGAGKNKVGMFELADDGTLFLDEIGEMSLPLQAKILRVLEEGEMFRIGGVKPIYVDVRIISATNRDLYKLVKQNKFRSDLFYRLNVLNIEIPPLRERLDDINLLAKHLLRNLTRRVGKNVSGFSDSAFTLLKSYYWPGNVRELRNCIEKAVIMSDSNIINENDLQFIVNTDKEKDQSDEIIPFSVMEKEMIVRALQKYGNDCEGKSNAAEALGISLRTLYNKINQYGLK